MLDRWYHTSTEVAALASRPVPNLSSGEQRRGGGDDHCQFIVE